MIKIILDYILGLVIVFLACLIIPQVVLFLGIAWITLIIYELVLYGIKKIF